MGGTPTQPKGEGFFRGWLWASLQRAGQSPAGVLAWSSVGFSLWHLSGVALATGFDLPAPQIPVFLINAAVLGAIWALLRKVSGSALWRWLVPHFRP